MTKFLLFIINAISALCSWCHRKLDPQGFSVGIAAFEDLKKMYSAAASDRDALKKVNDTLKRSLEKSELRINGLTVELANHETLIKGLSTELEDKRKLATPSDHMQDELRKLKLINESTTGTLNDLKDRMASEANRLPRMVCDLGLDAFPNAAWSFLSYFGTADKVDSAIGDILMSWCNGRNSGDLSALRRAMDAHNAGEYQCAVAESEAPEGGNE